MSDIEHVEDTGVPVDGLAAQLTDSVGLPDEAGEGDAVPNAVADELERYQEHADRRDEHLADDSEQTEQVEQQAQDKGRKQHVPLGALQEERQKRQAIAAEAEQLRQQLAAQQAQLQQFQAWQAQQQQAAQQAAIPEFADDPEGHVKALTAQFEQRLAAMHGEQQHRQQAEHVGRQIQHDVAQVTPFIAQVEPAFRAAHADYDDAREFVHEGIRNQLRAQHPGATTEQIQGIEMLAQLQFVRHCQVNNIDPCAYVYQLAQQRGFQTQHRAPRRAAPTSLSSLPGDGKAPDQRGTPKASDIAAMSNQQFDELFESMRASSVQQPWG